MKLLGENFHGQKNREEEQDMTWKKHLFWAEKDQGTLPVLFREQKRPWFFGAVDLFGMVEMRFFQWWVVGDVQRSGIKTSRFESPTWWNMIEIWVSIKSIDPLAILDFSIGQPNPIRKIPRFFLVLVDDKSQVPLTDLGLFLMALSGTKISRWVGDFWIHRHRMKANSCEMTSLNGSGNLF